MLSSPMASSPAIAVAVRLPASHGYLSASPTKLTVSIALKSCIVVPRSPFASQSRVKHLSLKGTSRTSTKIRCSVSVKSADSVNADADPSSSPKLEDEIEAEAIAKVGSRIRVTAPLKVYHVNRVPEVELEGMEGKLKDYVALWKGKRISANLPYKVELFKEIEGRDPVKFVAHLKEDEFKFIDP